MNKIRYVGESGESVFLEVPWGNIDKIPPPKLTFRFVDSDNSEDFFYMGRVQ